MGRRELRLIVYFGFVFGFLLGIPIAFLTVEVWSMWWLLPIAGVLIGYTTNLLGIRMIFEPVRPRRIGPLSVQGLFLKRQPEVAEVYAEIIADDIVTVGNMAEDLLHGPSSDRTRQMIEVALRPAVDNAVGRARPAVRVAVGTREYDQIRSSVAAEAADHTMAPLTDPEFVRAQSHGIREFVGGPDAEDGPGRLLRDAAHRDARGRVAALPPRRRARLRRRPDTPGDLRMNDETP